MLVAIDTGSRRPVRILRSRPTRHFLYLLVRCKCGKKFGHRADRPHIVCYRCGRMATLREVRGAPRRGKPQPAVKAVKRGKSTRRTVTAPAKHRRPTSPKARTA